MRTLHEVLIMCSFMPEFNKRCQLKEYPPQIAIRSTPKDRPHSAHHLRRAPPQASL